MPRGISSLISGAHREQPARGKRAAPLARSIAIALLVASAAPCNARADPATYDLAIVRGKVISGLAGARPVRADVGIVGDEIVTVGRIAAGEASRVIDARGKLVVPGFIDLHTHADMNILDNRQAANYLLQGVTTILGGNCGGSAYPLERLFRRLRRRGVGVNFCSLVGHLTARVEVMGYQQEPQGDDIRRMKRLVRKELRSGAMGLSTGLVYKPGLFASTEELIELASAAAEHGGFYASHIRSEGDGIRAAVEEAIRIGEENGIRVHISHIKLASSAVYDHPELISEPITAARARGLEVTTDQYPYTASGTSLFALVPWWAWGDGYEDFLEFLEDPDGYRRLLDFYVQTGIAQESMDLLYVALAAAHPDCEGKTLRQILTMKGLAHTPENAAEVIIELQQGGFVRVFFFGLRQEDVDSLAPLPFNAIASDSSALRIDDPGIPHPRNFGTFPRAIRLFVRQKKLLPVGDAIHKMTGLPASVLGLENRGLVRRGYRADIVVFDLRKIKDKATYRGAAHPRGITAVIVNGRVAARKGEVTGELAGEVLYGPGRRPGPAARRAGASRSLPPVEELADLFQ